MSRKKTICKIKEIISKFETPGNIRKAKKQSRMYCQLKKLGSKKENERIYWQELEDNFI